MWEPPKDQQIQARRADVLMGHVATQMATLITFNTASALFVCKEPPPCQAGPVPG